MNKKVEIRSFNSVAIANNLVARAQRGKRTDLSGNKLQDLVYLAHGWHLGLTAKALISQRVYAGHDGVFIPELRDAGCWGGNKVLEPISQIVMDSQKGVMTEHIPQLPANHPVLAVMARIWAIWGQMSAYELRDFVREHGAPWDLIWNDEDRTDDEPQLVPTGTIRLWFMGYVASEERKALAAAARKNNNIGDTQQLLVSPDPGRLRVV